MQTLLFPLFVYEVSLNEDLSPGDLNLSFKEIINSFQLSLEFDTFMTDDVLVSYKRVNK